MGQKKKQKAKQKTLKEPLWYRQLIADILKIKGKIITDLIWRKYEIGDRILKDENYLKKEKGDNYIKNISMDAQISERGLYHCIQVRNKFTTDELQTLLQQVAKITWKKIVDDYLPEYHREKIRIPLPEGEFDVIYADPAWKYDVRPPTDERMISSHYREMSLEEICEIKVPSHKDAILFLWCPKELIKQALKVIESWGFEYKTQFAWIKDKIGMGFWVRGQHEVLLIARRGDFPTPEPANRFSSVIAAPRTEHSKKPEIVYEMIEKMYPEGKYLELFARKVRKNWTGWGLEYGV